MKNQHASLERRQIANAIKLHILCKTGCVSKGGGRTLSEYPISKHWGWNSCFSSLVEVCGIVLQHIYPAGSSARGWSVIRDDTLVSFMVPKCSIAPWGEVAPPWEVGSCDHGVWCHPERRTAHTQLWRWLPQHGVLPLAMGADAASCCGMKAISLQRLYRLKSKLQGSQWDQGLWRSD